MLAGQPGEEDVVIGRIAADHDDRVDRRRTIGVTLIFRPPEPVGIVVLAGEEPCVRDARIRGEGQRKPDLEVFTLRAPREAPEAERRIGGKIVRLEISPVVRGVAALQCEHRRSLTPREEIPVEGSEGIGPLPRFGDRRRVGDREQLDVVAAELDQRIGRAEGMAGDRRRREPEAGPRGARCLEVADGNDDVVYGAGHGGGACGISVD